ncbi:TPA: transcriptional regulator NrdR, partial [Candidatus Woesearchaeota archaeon]|nr:transcriptional regulator NrdR [Candidatus Woesearchaeota archaeon]
MKCPYCGNPDTQVMETRETENLDATRRRRECIKCERRFTTYEKADLDEIIVVK